jgi:phosphate transport system substrate-binding protein
MQKRTGLRAGLAATAVAALTLATMAPAVADYIPRAGDVVGVGSDTVQYAADFLFSGDPAGDVGFNQGKVNQVVSFFATGDGNGRATYDGYCGSPESPCSATNSVVNSLATTAVLRVGTLPVPRPNGSGAGIAAITADSASPGYDGLPLNTIQFVRASRLPKAAEQSACAAISDCGGLNVFQFADDNLEIAHAPITNVPALSAVELAAIYLGVGPDKAATTSGCVTNFSQLNGFITGTTYPNQTIYPDIPQSGSGTRNFFLADLDAAAGSTSTTLCSDVATSEEHDPTGITLSGGSDTTANCALTTAPNICNALEPFSTGRALLLTTNPETGATGQTNGGYFANSGEPASYLTISLTPGCSVAETGFNPSIGACKSADQIKAADGNPVYDSNRGLYFLVRNTSLTSTTIMEPGGTQNFANALFDGANSWVASANEAANIEEAGLDPSYANLGDDSSG